MHFRPSRAKTSGYPFIAVTVAAIAIGASVVLQQPWPAIAGCLVSTVIALLRRRDREAFEVELPKAIDDADLGMVITDPRLPDNPIIYVNQSFLTMTGYTREECLGRNCRFIQSHDVVSPELLGLRAAIKAGRPHRCRVRNRRKDGSTFWNDLTLTPVQGSDGRPLYFLGIQVDVTAQMTTVQQLAEREDRYRTLFAAVAEGIVVQDEQGRILEHNQAAEQILGLTADQLTGKSSLDKEWGCVHEDGRPWPGEDHPSMVCARTKALVPPQIMGVIRPDGSYAWIQVTSVPALTNATIVTVTSFVDLTALKRVEYELRHARDAAIAAIKVKSDFLATMSHEIRTPMNGIIGMTDLLLSTKLDDHQVDCAQTVRSCADGLLVLINDILDFSKIEAGRLELEAVDFDPVHECEEALGLIADQAEEKGLTLICDPDPDLPRMVLGDPGRIRQILFNLVGNAIKFTAHGAVNVRIAAVARRGGWTLQLEVEDTGVGITDEAMGRLFQPFVQADASTTRRFGGTGLGLVISRRLAKLMGGEVTATSTAGVGSIFTCALQVGHATKESGSGILPSLHGRVVLVAAPPAQSRALARRLSTWGAEVVQKADRAAAEEWLAGLAASGGVCTLAIIDRDLPGGALGFVAAMPTNIPRILVVPMRDQAFTKQASAQGTVLSRPITVSQCASAVASLLGQTSAQSQRRHHDSGIQLTGRILVAEDNQVNQRVLLAILKRLGLSAQAVGNGAEAVKAVQGMAFDLILMDCQMPEMDGYLATATIRAQEVPGRRIPILALTADVIEGTREQCLVAGMDDYLTKPIRQAELSQALSRWLSHATPSDVVESSAAAVLSREPRVLLDCDSEVIRQLVKDLDTEAEPMLNDICARFTGDCEVLVSGCFTALNGNDLAEVGRLAHRLRGQCLVLGLAGLVEMARKLEQAAKNGSLPEAVALAGSLQPLIAKAQIALSAACAASIQKFNQNGKPAQS